MATEYDIFIKAPEVERSADICDFLLSLGASESFYLESPVPDQMLVIFPEHGVWITRLAYDGEAYRPGDFEFGYDFRLSVKLAFFEDDSRMRQIIALLASRLAETYELLLTYNSEATILQNNAPGGSLFKPDGHDASYYVKDWVRNSFNILRGLGHVIHPRTELIGPGDLTIGERHDRETEEPSQFSIVTELRVLGQAGPKAIESTLRRCSQNGRSNVTLDLSNASSAPNDFWQALLSRASYQHVSYIPEQIQLIYLDSCNWYQLKPISRRFVESLANDEPEFIVSEQSY